MVNRAILTATALLLSMGCSCSSSEPPPELGFDEVDVTLTYGLDGGSLSISIRPESTPKHCADRITVVPSINGVDAGPSSGGGGFRENGHLECEDIYVLERFEAGTNDIDITFQSDDDPEVSGWHIAAEWDPIATDVWVEQDIYQAMRDGEPFSIHWSPPDAPGPGVQASSIDLLSPAASEPILLEEVEHAPGVARYRVAGELPSYFNVYARDFVRPSPTLCEGFTRCRVEVRTSFDRLERRPPP